MKAVKDLTWAFYSKTSKVVSAASFESLSLFEWLINKTTIKNKVSEKGHIIATKKLRIIPQKTNYFCEF